jgi:hypothetical protein
MLRFEAMEISNAVIVVDRLLNKAIGNGKGEELLCSSLAEGVEVAKIMNARVAQSV